MHWKDKIEISIAILEQHFAPLQHLRHVCQARVGVTNIDGIAEKGLHAYALFHTAGLLQARCCKTLRLFLPLVYSSEITLFCGQRGLVAAGNSIDGCWCKRFCCASTLQQAISPAYRINHIGKA